MITLPSSAKDFDSPQSAPTSSATCPSGVVGARDRIALMRMAWDFIGTEFGSRHQQYEKFYGGASFLVKTEREPHLRLHARDGDGRARIEAP